MSPKKKTTTTKVELDPKTVDKFESALRNGLVASAAVIAKENKKSRLRKTSAKVELDSETVARLSEILRKGLVACHARITSENESLNKLTAQIKKRSKLKSK